jgi:hypothetical protein
MEGKGQQDSGQNPDTSIRISVNVDAKEGVGETEKMDIFHAFNDAVNELKNEWEHPEAEKLTIIILSGEAYRTHRTEGPMTWKTNFLIRSGSRDKEGNLNERYIICNADIFRETSDPENQIKHEAAHLIIEQLVGDRETYKGCYLLEEGLASYDGATEKLKERLKEEGQSLNDIKNPLGFRSMDDVRKNDDEAFTESIDYLTMFSFGEFLKERLGAKGAIELYKATGEHGSIEKAYKEITGKDFGELIERWQETLMRPEELTEKYSQEVAEFFGIPEEEDIELVIFESMEDMATAFNEQVKEDYELLKEQGKKNPDDEPPTAPKYLKGLNLSGNRYKEIWLVKPGVPDENGTIMSGESFRKRLKHELTHLYVRCFLGTRDTMDKKVPVFLEEGLCYIVAGQKNIDPGEITRDRLRDLTSTDKADKYAVGYKVAKLIVDEQGKDKLLEIIKSNDPDKIIEECMEYLNG